MTKKAEQAIRQQVSRAHPFVSCGNCDRRGWTYSMYWDTAIRCPCWLAHAAKVDQLVADELGREGSR